MDICDAAASEDPRVKEHSMVCTLLLETQEASKLNAYDVKRLQSSDEFLLENETDRSESRSGYSKQET